MRSLRLIALHSIIMSVILTARRTGKDKFDPHAHHCGAYGTWKDGKCECERHFHGDKCEIYFSRRCTKDEDCGETHAFCLHKMTIQCRLSPHCEDPSGWCQPLDPSPR